jgi:hypothetical protein
MTRNRENRLLLRIESIVRALGLSLVIILSCGEKRSDDEEREDSTERAT